jgi:hypothetical protein
MIYRKILDDNFRGNGLKHLTKTNMIKIKIPILPKDHQERIVEKLDTILNNNYNILVSMLFSEDTLTTDIVTGLLIICVSTLATIGGVGGGGILIPLYILLTGLPLDNAIPLAIISILGNSIICYAQKTSSPKQEHQKQNHCCQKSVSKNKSSPKNSTLIINHGVICYCKISIRKTRPCETTQTY